MLLAHYTGYSVYGNCPMIPYVDGLREKVHASAQWSWEATNVSWVCPNTYLLQKTGWFWGMCVGGHRVAVPKETCFWLLTVTWVLTV